MSDSISKNTYSLPIPIDGLQYVHLKGPIELELGGYLPELTIAYHTYGQLNPTRDNVLWVCHALTANSDVADWWAELFGAVKPFDPEKYFIVCANILGSCYGTTGPASTDPEHGKRYGLDFPKITIRDLALVHGLLCKYLNINGIALAVGGSCGGHQVLEMAIDFPVPIQKMALLVTSARESAWAIAIHEAGRMALEADTSFRTDSLDAGAAGLQAARAIGLLSYRTSDSYIDRQTDTDERTSGYSAASYMRYQGTKLNKRFYAHSYWCLLNCLDTHHIGRGRGSLEAVLNAIHIPALVLGVDTDQLIPPAQQTFLARHLPNATYQLLHSKFGHDGFLIETVQIQQAIEKWLMQYR